MLAAILPIGAVAVAADEAPVPSVTNPDFSSTTSSGAPSGWSVWNPAGRATAAVEPTGGPGGGSAVRITSASGSDARYALTQAIPITDATPRKLTVSAQVKGEGLASGFSMVRVQAYDQTGKTIVPVARGPYLRGTFGWQNYNADIVLPAGTRKLSIEPMLDRTSGSLWVTRVALAQTTATNTLTATATAAGPVELSWSFGEPPPAGAHYTVYRGEGAQTPPADEAHLLKSAYAATTADDTAAAGEQYTYLVQVVGPNGEAGASTPGATATTPAVFDRDRSITTLTALADGKGKAHISWALADGIRPDEVFLDTDRRVFPRRELSAESGSLQLSVPVGTNVRIKKGTKVLAAATVGGPSHPRSVATRSALATIRTHLADHTTTTTAAWEALLTRIDGPDSAYSTNGSGGLYKARDAALAFAVTGEANYAQTAYEAIMRGAGFVAPRDVNQGLELARAELLLAPAYDWAYNGWTEKQRDDVRHLMTRATDLLSTYHHAALDDPQKTSNWVGVVRSTELAALLSARGDGDGDGDFGLYDQRIAFLTDQVAQHLDQGYSDNGHSQEGWDYFHYTQLYLFPSVYFAQGTGLKVLDQHFERPKFWNLALHDVSSRAAGDVAQYGASGPNGQTDGTFPLLFPASPKGAWPGLLHLYDHVQGKDSARKTYDGVHGLWAVLYYPEDHSADPRRMSVREAREAIVDDAPGFYSFRSDYEDTGDQLIVTSNRNQLHRGWSAAETFSLSWVGNDTTWAAQGGKHSTAPLEWSKPKVDGKLEPYADQYTTERGDGVTIASRAFPGQGGGYLHLDGSKNFGVTTADREQVVDLSGKHGVDAIVAIRDRFADDTSHEWDWDLKPGAGVTISINHSPAAGEPLFTLHSANGAVLSGFAADPQALTVTNQEGTLRLSRTGTSAEFALALVTSDHAMTASHPESGTLDIAGRRIDFDRLSSAQRGLPQAQ